MSVLYLPEPLRTRIASWVSAGYPLETCGLLIGRQNGAGVTVSETIAARNLNRERAQDRFELDPEAFIEADRQARDAGLELVGVWHSHPDHPPRPSATDRSFAWEGWSYLILSVDSKGVEDMRSWRLADDDFVEEAILP
ncbi:MAG TPA: M67 family metallopeptidase [Novimethylophilus sp.]|jgi:proteasome lid subunit RPN8/RPN11|uniref:M67 family metallopeptidase n=1 Tax=Novimethylophilus sp. TaxID=2137426 RepID=UPI002F40B9E1